MGFGLRPPTRYVLLGTGSRDFLSHQGPLSLCPAEGAVGSGSETWRNSAGSGRGASPSLALENKASLKPVPRGARFLSPVLWPRHIALSSSHAHGCTPGEAEGSRASSPILVMGCSEKTVQSALGATSATSPVPVLSCRKAIGMGCPCLGTCCSKQSSPLLGHEPVLGRMGLHAVPALGWEWETELLWQWLICEQGWFVHVSLDSLVYFFKAGGCFLNSKVLLCNFPNKAF